jgi:hypothetical protein
VSGEHANAGRIRDLFRAFLAGDRAVIQEIIPEN